MVVMINPALPFTIRVAMKTNHSRWLILALIILGLFLRTHQVTSSPPALYWEEAALGYDAYAIAETGRDHHGHQLPLIAFESFGDWKPSLYFYYLVPFVKFFCLNDWAVRISGVVLGGFLIWGLYYLAQQLKFPPKWTLFVIVLSPWAIHFARGAWEAHLALVLVTWGVGLWWRAVNSSKKWLFVGAAISLGLASYAYHAARLTVPLLVITLLLVSLICKRTDWLQSKIKWKHQALVLPFGAACIVALLMLPLLFGLLNPNSSAITQRYKETGITSDLDIISISNQLKADADNTIAARIFYHRYVMIAREVIKNIFSYSSLSFWAINGDANPRHGTGFTGLIYNVEIIFLVWGLVVMMKRRQATDWLLWGWFMAAILPAALAKPNPHALRILPALPPIILFISLGLNSSANHLATFIRQFEKKDIVKNNFRQFLSQNGAKKIICSIIICIYALELISFYRYYLRVYPILAQHEWQYGYEQLVKELATDIAQGTPIHFARSLGRPAMYVWFYTQEDPREVQARADMEKFDQGEFISYQNISYDREVDVSQIGTGEVGVVLASKVDLESLTNFDVTIVNGLDDRPIWCVLRKTN